MGKIIIGKWTVRTAKSLYKTMETLPRNEREAEMLRYLEGIYSTRKLGLVIYRWKLAKERGEATE